MERISCHICGKSTQRRNLPNHITYFHEQDIYSEPQCRDPQVNEMAPKNCILSVKDLKCPRKECYLYQASTKTALIYHLN